MGAKGSSTFPKVNETGNRYGKLLVVGYAGRTPRGMATWECRCDCGVKKTIRVGCLRDGSSRSCGCGLSHTTKDEVGKRYSRLVVLGKHGFSDGKVTWNCRCDCGNLCVVSGANLRRKATRSCGCLRATHRLKGTREHRTWQAMRQRCMNPENPKFKDYGGRGINVCRRWESFENFLADMGTCPSRGSQIDRINNNRGYEPKNCRWVSCKQNNRNRRDNRILEFNGEKRCLAEWAEVAGLKVGTLWMRLNNGWSVERAVATPLLKQG